jgi:hypothetical protein
MMPRTDSVLTPEPCLSWGWRVFHWAGRHHDRQTGALVAALWVLSLADLVFTLWAHRFTTCFGELNPVADALLRRNLIPSVVLLKLVTTAIGATIFWRLRTHTHARLALCLLVLAYLALLFQWSNYTDLAMAAAPSL